MIFQTLASSGKPCSAISLTLRWFPVARKMPIIYLLTLQKVCKQSPVARQKAYYGSEAITRKPQRAGRPNSLPKWALGRESCSCRRKRCGVHAGVSLRGWMPQGRSGALPPKSTAESSFLGTLFSRNSSAKLPQPVLSGRWKEMNPLAGTLCKWFPNLSDPWHPLRAC